MELTQGMTNQGQTLSEEFHRHETLAVKLHELFLAGLGESPEAEEIRDQMDFTWRKLSTEEIEWDNGIAEDLNNLENHISSALPSLVQIDEFQRKLFAEPWFAEANELRRRMQVLAFLRKEYKANKASAFGVRRAQVDQYFELTLYRVGLLISEVSEKIWPEFRISTIRGLRFLNRNSEAIEKAKSILKSPASVTPDEVNFACDILFDLGTTTSDVSIEKAIRHAIQDLQVFRSTIADSQIQVQNELTILEASLAAKLGALIGPTATVKEFPASHATRSLFRHTAKLEPVA